MFPTFASAITPVLIDAITPNVLFPIMSERGVAYFPATANTIIQGVNAGTEASTTAQTTLLQSYIRDMNSVATQNSHTEVKATIEAAKEKMIADTNLKVKDDQQALAKAATPAPATCSIRTDSANFGVIAAASRVELAALNSSTARKMHYGARAQGGSSSSVALMQLHESMYCDPATSKTCPIGSKPALDGTSNPRPLIDADKRVSSLLQGANNSSDDKGQGQDVMTYTRPQLEAAKAYVDNVTIGAVTPRQISASEAATPAGKVYLAKQLEYEAVLDASRAGLDEIIVSRTPIYGSSDLTKNMVQNASKKSGEYIKTELAKIKNRTGSGDISTADLMRIEVGRRSGNVGWMEEMQSTLSPQALQKEQIYLLALIAKMMYAQRMNEERMTVMQSIQASDMIRTRLVPELQRIDKSVIANSGQ